MFLVVVVVVMISIIGIGVGLAASEVTVICNRRKGQPAAL
jgi:hypothetical protein